MKNYQTDETGFTLVELLIVIAIVSVVLAGVTGLFTRTSKYHTAQEMMVETTQRVRAAKHLMVDELRSAGCDPEETGDMGFQYDADDEYNTDANSVHFTRDIDNSDNDEHYEPDGDADDSNEDISYWRQDDDGNILDPGDDTVGTLVRDTGGGGQTVAEDIVDLEFTYYDENNDEIDPDTLTRSATLGTIRSVEVRIVGQVQRTVGVSEDNQLWEQQFRVKIRNL